MTQRTIKFRAWDGKQIHYNIPIASVSVGIFLEFRGSAFQLMQFTGLKDKNGKEIFEGDILNIEIMTGMGSTVADKGEVIFHPEAAQFVIAKRLHGSYVSTSIGLNVEIIGNIYENPNLLK